MSEAELKALEYFEAASKIAHKIPDVKWAIDLVVTTFRRWTLKGWENAATGAGHAALRWFQTWNDSGREGGRARFENGLKAAMRWSALRVRPGTVKMVQGFELDGTPHFDKRRGPCAIETAEASELVRKLNLECKLERSHYRYAVTAFARPGRGNAGMTHLRAVKRYEIEWVQRAKELSFDWDDGDGLTGEAMISMMRRADGSRVSPHHKYHEAA